MKFSERFGFSKPKTLVQSDGMDEDLRNLLWQVIINFVVQSDHQAEIINKIWIGYFKKPIDTLPIINIGFGSVSYERAFSALRKYFLK